MINYHLEWKKNGCWDLSLVFYSPRAKRPPTALLLPCTSASWNSEAFALAQRTRRRLTWTTRRLDTWSADTDPARRTVREITPDAILMVSLFGCWNRRRITRQTVLMMMELLREFLLSTTTDCFSLSPVVSRLYHTWVSKWPFGHKSAHKSAARFVGLPPPPNKGHVYPARLARLK